MVLGMHDGMDGKHGVHVIECLCLRKVKITRPLRWLHSLLEMVEMVT